LFVELMPLLKQRTLLITVARVDERLKVNVIPVKAKEGEDEALTTPLGYTGSQPQSRLGTPVSDTLSGNAYHSTEQAIGFSSLRAW